MLKFKVFLWRIDPTKTFVSILQKRQFWLAGSCFSSVWNCSEMGATLKGKNLLPKGVNSSLYEKTLMSREANISITEFVHWGCIHAPCGKLDMVFNIMQDTKSSFWMEYVIYKCVFYIVNVVDFLFRPQYTYLVLCCSVNKKLGYLDNKFIWLKCFIKFKRPSIGFKKNRHWL